MRKMIISIVSLLIVVPSLARVDALATKTALMQQLQLSLDMNINNMNLPENLLAKLPVTTAIEEITPSFLSAWTQVTFLACDRAIQTNRIQYLSDENEVKEWIKSFTAKSWGVEATNDEVEEIYQAGYGLKHNTSRHQMSFSCSMVLSSPKVYVVSSEGE